MHITKSINAGTSTVTTYIPVPEKGIVTGLKVSYNKTVATSDTFDIQQGSTSVCLATVGSGNTAAGVVIDGVRDTDNKNLEFDPDSSTAANKVLKVVISALESASTLVELDIEYDVYSRTGTSSSGIYTAVTAS